MELFTQVANKTMYLFDGTLNFCTKLRGPTLLNQVVPNKVRILLHVSIAAHHRDHAHVLNPALAYIALRLTTLAPTFF